MQSVNVRSMWQLLATLGGSLWLFLEMLLKLLHWGRGNVLGNVYYCDACEWCWCTTTWLSTVVIMCPDLPPCTGLFLSRRHTLRSGCETTATGSRRHGSITQPSSVTQHSLQFSSLSPISALTPHTCLHPPHPFFWECVPLQFVALPKHVSFDVYPYSRSLYCELRLIKRKFCVLWTRPFLVYIRESILWAFLRMQHI